MNFLTKFLMCWCLTATLLAYSFHSSNQSAREEVLLLRVQISEQLSRCPTANIITTYWTKFASFAAILFFILFWYTSGSQTSANENARLKYELKELQVKTMTKHITNECSICLSNPFQVVLIPCGHICLCCSCLEQLNSNKKCPVCRAPYQKHVNIYFA